MSNNGKSTVSGFIWMFMERIGGTGLGIIISFVLARLMDPEAYGTVAIVNSFTPLFSALVSSGMGAALIQKKDADDLDFSTFFYFNIFACVVLYLAFYFIAPFIAKTYKMAELVALLRVGAFAFFISGLSCAQFSYCYRKKLFKKLFYASFISTVVSGVVGILMAYKQLGAWALIVQSLVFNATSILVLWIIVDWYPKRMFSFERLKKLYKYGWKILCTSMMNMAYSSISPLIIGYKYKSENLAYYNKGMSLPSMLVNVINPALDKVLFPAMSDYQNEKDRVKWITRQSIQIGTFVVFPLLVGLFVCAEDLTIMLLTEKWIAIVPYVRIFCVYYMMQFSETMNQNVVKSSGASGVFLIMETVKKVVGLIVLAATVSFGVIYIALGQIICMLIGQTINAFITKKIIGYSYKEQISDILPAVLASVLMGIMVYMVTFFDLSSITTLALQVLCGAIIYFVIASVTKMDGLVFLKNTVFGLIKHKE